MTGNKVVTFGEALLRLSAPGFFRIGQCSSFDASYGGAEANVAASLAAFGMKTEFVTRLPANEIGDACLAYFRRLNVGLDHVVRGGDRLGLFFFETGAAQRPSVVLYDRAFSGQSMITPGMVDWNAVFSGAVWLHISGITPALSKSAAETCLEAVQMAHQHGLTISCDLNYRSKLWQWGKQPIEVMPEIVRYCHVLIGNEEDAEKVLGVTPSDTDILSGNVEADPYRYVCLELFRRFPRITTIAFTLRGSLSASHNTWSGVMWRNNHFFSAPRYDIKPIVDRLGGGDSFAAGLIYGLLNFEGDDQKTLDFAVAASCLKHSILYDINLVTLAEVEKLMHGDASGRVSR